MIDENRQELLVRACGWVLLMFVIDWSTNDSWFEVRRNKQAVRCNNPAEAAIEYEKMCKTDAEA